MRAHPAVARRSPLALVASRRCAVAARHRLAARPPVALSRSVVARSSVARPVGMEAYRTPQHQVCRPPRAMPRAAASSPPRRAVAASSSHRRRLPAHRPPSLRRRVPPAASSSLLPRSTSTSISSPRCRIVPAPPPLSSPYPAFLQIQLLKTSKRGLLRMAKKQT